MLFFIFLLVTLAVTGLYAFLAPAVTVWRVLGVALLAWLGANLLLVLLFVVNWLFLPRLGPDEGIERQRPLSPLVTQTIRRRRRRRHTVRPPAAGTRAFFLN